MEFERKATQVAMKGGGEACAHMTHTQGCCTLTLSIPLLFPPSIHHVHTHKQTTHNAKDMLQVGNIKIGSPPMHGSPPALFPDAEGRTQLALWALLKAPLLVGTFVHNLTAATKATLTDAVALAVNQDPLGEQGALRKSGGCVCPCICAHA